MTLREWTEREWLEGERARREAVFFYTPLCGTCKAALRMLEVIDAMELPIAVSKVNINFAPFLRDEWRIASVPALFLVREGEPVHAEYAMRSVDTLYRLLKEFAANP
ncbi:thioredoxin family protein [Paenibacillus sp. R14(2021)]|uniref:thioredoxin family protein n=1 Tax=Paenibacillus sp. R14(2021) TaxID=2859228 RepID=UPI001C612A96|nr:thioredoxin family protein [Paenibacillus sp. R14(2021)]